MRVALFGLSGLVLTLTVPSGLLAAPPTGPVVETPLAFADQIRPPERRNPGEGPIPLNFREVFSPDSYPELATEREVEGKVIVRVQVNAEGLPTHCETLGNPPAELGGPTCALMLANARFAPKLDRKGRPTKGVFEQAIEWRLEDLEPLAFADSTARLIFEFDDDATITGCRTEMPPNAPHLGKDAIDPCKAMAIGAKFIAASANLGDLSQWELWTEHVFRTGKEEFWRSIGEGPDERLVSRLGFRLTMNSDGTVRDCATTEPGQDDLPGIPVSCEQWKKGLFAKSSDPTRIIHIVDIVYLRRKTPSAKTI